MYISHFTLRFYRTAKKVVIGHNKLRLRFLDLPLNNTRVHISRCRILWNVFYTWSVSSQLNRALPFNVVDSKIVDHYRSICLKSLDHLQIKNSEVLTGYFLWILWVLWECCQSFLRIVQLACIFVPLSILYPLTFFNSSLRSIWYHILLFGVEFSGPIFMKLGQWASTRRDLFSEELCSHLSKLQRKTKPHSWYYTKKTLERAYGPQWQSILIKVDNERLPIGSGCCAQVYKAWITPAALLANVPLYDILYEGSEHSLFIEGLELLGVGYILGALDKNDNQRHAISSEGLIPVAVKVLHPRMETLLRRDLRIMKAVAAAVTWIVPSLRWLSLADCVDDFAHTMQAQVNFCEEAVHLERFARNFKDVDSVKFPRPVWPLTMPNLLVETFEEGQHIEHFVTSKDVGNTNKRLAEVGINTILKMVFEDNFAHGDMHPGNMLVQKVHEQSVKNSSRFWWSRSSPPPFRLVVLDCGLVSTLDERGRTCLKEVFAAVVMGDGERVAELFLNHSNHQCTDESSFKSSMNDIVHNALDKKVTLEQVEVSTLMTALFSTMIRHRVKLDGSFSSVILAIMVLEGLGRSLDPTIDMIDKARPFLLSSL